MIYFGFCSNELWLSLKLKLQANSLIHFAWLRILGTPYVKLVNLLYYMASSVRVCFCKDLAALRKLWSEAKPRAPNARFIRLISEVSNLIRQKLDAWIGCRISAARWTGVVVLSDRNATPIQTLNFCRVESNTYIILTLWILKVHQINAVFNPKITFLAAMALNEP